MHAASCVLSTPSLVRFPSALQAAQLEGYVLESLKWRLGPYFDLSPDGGF